MIILVAENQSACSDRSNNNLTSDPRENRVGESTTDDDDDDDDKPDCCMRSIKMRCFVGATRAKERVVAAINAHTNTSSQPASHPLGRWFLSHPSERQKQKRRRQRQRQRHCFVRISERQLKVAAGCGRRRRRRVGRVSLFLPTIWLLLLLIGSAAAAAATAGSARNHDDEKPEQNNFYAQLGRVSVPLPLMLLLLILALLLLLLQKPAMPRKYWRQHNGGCQRFLRRKQ